MKRLELECYGFVRSCVNDDLVGVGETIFVYTVPDRFTDDTWDGVLSATVLTVYKECDNCYNYVLEYDETALPSGIAALSQCDIAALGCEDALPTTTVDVVIDARLQADNEDPNCFNLIVTKQTLNFVGNKGAVTESESQHCNVHPYPSTTDPATW